MLTDTSVRSVQASSKGLKLFDSGGLYLLVTPKGAKLWRLKYRYDGREKLISLGAYPAISLKGARARRDDARRLLAEGVDPSAQRKASRAAQADTLQAIAQEWLDKQGHLEESTVKRDRDRLTNFVLPHLGSWPVKKITAPDLLMVLRRIESRGRLETAHRTRAIVGRVLRYAIATGRAERDVSADLKGALAPARSENHAAIVDPQRVGELLRAIEGYVGQPETWAALRLAPLVFLRPGELRGAQWAEIDLEAAEWRVPGERMKMGEQHLVPLATQAIAILREIEPLTRRSSSSFIFPGLRTSTRPISENTINAALRRLGYSKEEQTGHGFRTIASTLLNEQGWHPDVIELQLAHAERNKVRAAYNRAQRLPERRRMMQAWADYLDGLKAGSGNIVAIGAARAQE